MTRAASSLSGRTSSCLYLAINCTRAQSPSSSVFIQAASNRLAGEVETFYHGAGCSKCRNTGYSGWIGIYELLVPDDGMRDKITAAPSINELHALARQAGMVTLRQDGMAKVKAGITTVEEIFRATAA